ncbi:MAG: extracellular solute-binding protein [Candidatus Hydrogenedentes bacterium]|nr:extracellular solute-binding protein [Candidatus Hydrogenedentota bacterium]
MALGMLGCSTKEVVVVYSPHGAEMLGDYEKLFEEKYPEVDMQWLDMGSQEVYSRVSAERGRPAGDVWWGGPSTTFVQAAQGGEGGGESLLGPYRPTWADQVEEDFKDPGDQWYATHRSSLSVLFNTQNMQAAAAPQTWDDLVTPAWAGRITLRKPLGSGTMRTFLAAMIMRAPSEDEGFAWLKRLHENTASYPESPNLLFDHLKKNPDRVSVWLLPDIILQRDRNGFPFGYHVPPDTPILTEGIAILRNAPHLEWAKRFYEFVTSRESLVQQATAYAKMPARQDIEPAQLPEWMTAQALQPMHFDQEKLAEKEGDWVRRWEQEVYSAR